MVCKQELKLAKSDDEDDMDLEICPVCGVNYMHSNLAMCEECAAKPNARKQDDPDLAEDEDLQREDEQEDSWGEERVSEDDEVEIVSLSELEEDDDDDINDDSFDDDDDDASDFANGDDNSDNEFDDDDDFDYVDPDEFSDEDLEDDEDDEDEDDE